MNPKLRASLLLAAMGACAAPAFAYNEVTYVTPYPIDYYYTAAPREYAVAPSTTYLYSEPTYYYAPRVEYVAPPVTVTAPWLSEDRAITEDVVDVLSSDSRLSGKIGVETERNSVRLTGRVTTPGQARIAGMDAQSVDGVREVRNELKARVGGSP